MDETSNGSFSYHDLPDPAINIRLLRINPGHNDDPIECSLSTFSTRDPPGYAAISYTWGDPLPTRAISIDGGHVEEPRATYYWIDALCINQLHLREKAHQVDMMGDIFSKAEQVLVSLGPHSDCSAFLTSSLKEAPRTDHVDDAWRIWLSNFHARGIGLVDRHCECVVWLGNRPYWERISIIQEIVLGHNVLLLFDSDSIHLNTIRGLFKTLSDQANAGVNVTVETHIFELYGSPMARLIAYIESRIRVGSPGSLPELLLYFEKNICSEELDHIYALLSLMAVPKEGSTDIRADYSKDTFDLAVDCLSYLDQSLEWSSIKDMDIVRQAHLLFRALGVDSKHPKLQTITNKRRHAIPQNLTDGIGKISRLGDQESKHRREVPPIPGKTCPPYPCRRFRYSYHQRDILRLRLDEEGNFTGGFARQPNGEPHFRISHSIEVGQASFLNLGTSIVGLLCAPARAGDCVIKLSMARLIVPCLVIRQYGPVEYAIIGQALIVADLHLCPGGSLCSSGCGCKAEKGMRFDVDFHEEDLIALAAQELAESEEGSDKCFPSVLEPTVEQLRRLQTDVTLSDWSSWAVFRVDTDRDQELT